MGRRGEEKGEEGRREGKVGEGSGRVRIRVRVRVRGRGRGREEKSRRESRGKYTFILYFP